MACPGLTFVLWVIYRIEPDPVTNNDWNLNLWDIAKDYAISTALRILMDHLLGPDYEPEDFSAMSLDREIQPVAIDGR